MSEEPSVTSNRTDRFVEKLASLLVLVTYRDVDQVSVDDETAQRKAPFPSAGAQ